MLRSVPGTERAERVADVVFVHGLNPLGVLNRDHAFKTWGGKDEHSEFWPKWLGEDLAKADIPVGVWILEYDAAALGWLGHAMPLPDRATSVLDELYGKRIGDRPTIFVAHSLGGLVVKQMLQRSATMGLTTERAIAERTRGVMFLATPHTGADMATFVSSLGRVLRQTDALKELAANSAPLRELSTWYLNQSPRLGIETRSYFETRETMGIRVVDETSADPHVAGASAVPIDANHSEIAAIPSRSAPHYESIVRFVEEALCIQTATQADPPATRVGSDPDSRWIGGTIVPANPEWNVPPAPVYFTGQEEYLDQVAAALKKSRVGGIFQAAALHGFGGIGKTALALRYAELHRDEYAKGYFVASESADSLTSGFAQHCGQVLPANAPPEMMEAAAREGLRKMAEGGLSLIIFDNADDLIGKCALFDEALRELRSRHVLVTSRNSSFIERCEPVEIEKMDSKVGGFFFYRLWKRNPDAEWEGVPPSEQAVCEEMSRELDGMPLALEQAGIAAVDESLDPRTLLKDYRERKSRRIAMLKGRPSGHGQVPLWATVERALDGLSPAARELVILCAFMDPDFIDERLFTDWKMKLPDVLEASRDAWPAVRAEAIRSALIKGVTEQDPLVSEGNPRSRFSIHRAVQATILEMGSERQADRWWEGGGEAALALHALGRFREGL
ncbi:MAG TPA: AAA family ATPase, partial [Fimbriimonadaceae bacterium]|nr:AAA family ATPase [Fimbriimonadaceae bacterium]